jgi:hypothetical protein
VKRGIKKNPKNKKPAADEKSLTDQHRSRRLFPSK